MKVSTELKQQNSTIVKASAHIVEIERYKGSVSPMFVDRLEAYRMPLLRIIAQKNEFYYYAMRTLNSLNAAIEYAKGDIGARKRMISEYKARDRIAKRLGGGIK
ncbi:hypothetical protein EYB33_14630 [Lysinibacillus sphaericus]|uniref:hypothetical protein n=1 Tax=Lysinibacillus sphaericus TaxID=1421 RepID=UPI001E51154B|nr:hypothetical protein [Lysinibacillus sphaericus]UDK97466.1 hypothetical protein EYB33_14630 [Lysinibacillus sphaericus]